MEQPDDMEQQRLNGHRHPLPFLADADGRGPLLPLRRGRTRAGPVVEPMLLARVREAGAALAAGEASP